MMVSFALRFCSACVVLYGLINWLPAFVLMNPLNRYTAEMTSFLLGAIGLKPTVQGVMVSAGGFAIKVITECSAIFAAALFLSFVLAYPATIRQKAVGLLFGIPVLFAVNMVRLVVIFLVGMRFRSLFDYVHVYIGQILMILLVLLVSMLWLRSAGKAKSIDPPPRLSGAFPGMLQSSVPLVDPY